MIANASVILLDLREYSQQRKGTRFELTELLRRAPIDKVVLLIDAKENVHGLATNAGTAIAALHEELPQVSAIFVFLVIRSSPQMDRTGKSDRRDEREHVSVSNLSSVNKAIGQQTLAHGASFLGGPLAS
jgi:hypothetical protein